MKKGMEENGQRTDPGTDGRQEQEDAVLRGQLQQALDSVEPDGEARERMLRRIREKAAARQTADEPTPCDDQSLLRILGTPPRGLLGAASAVRASDRRLPVHPDDYALACAGSDLRQAG